MYPYINDIFHAQASTNQRVGTCDISLRCHFKLGFIINPKKSALVLSQIMLHLGALIDTARGLVFPSPAKTETIIHATRALLGLSQVSALRLRQVTGLLASCHALVPLCTFRLRPLSTLLRDHFDMRVDRTSKLIPLSSPVIWSTLEFWSCRDLVSQGIPLQPLPPSHVLTTDASTYGWGAVCGPLTARGVWSSDQSYLHINFLELETVFLALKTFQKWLCGAHVLVQTDSTTVMHYLNRAGGTRSRSLDWKVRKIIHWCLSMRITLSAVHISGQDNVEVDRLSQVWIENPRRLERSTKCSLDRRVTNLLFDIWGLPTVDLFATRLNNKVEAFFSRLPDPLALQGNSLQADWSKGLLYMYLPCPPPVPCSSQGDQGGGSGHSYSTMVATKRVVSPGPTAPSGPASDVARARWSSTRPRWDRVPRPRGTPPSHLETLGRSLRSRGITREAAATICAAHRPSK